MKISIIIPVFNSENYIDKCLKSIFNQSFDLKEVEVIIINDGSIDKSEEKIQKYNNSLNIIYLSQVNKGQSYARNIGLSKAKGKYITFLDSDDYISPDMLNDLYNIAEEHNLDIVTCDLAKVKNNIIKQVKDRIVDDEIKNFILTKTGPCNMLVKRSLLEKNNFSFPNNLRKYEDIAVIPTLGLKENIKIKHIDKVYYFYNDNDNSIMNVKSYSDKLNDIFISMEILYANAKNEKSFSNYKDEIEYLFIRHLIMSAGLRYARFNDPENKLEEIKKTMSKKFPNWKKNKYYKKCSIKLKITTALVLNKNIYIIKMLDKLRRKNI